MEENNKMDVFKKPTRVSTCIAGLSIFVLICIVAGLFVWIRPLLVTTPREQMQQELAIELGVEIGEYPHPSNFPLGYFFTVLKPGMSISEVHKIVRGYKKALRCGETMEVYYYLGENIEDSVRFWIYYDEQGKFREFQGEGDSGRRSTSWCSPGLQEE